MVPADVCMYFLEIMTTEGTRKSNCNYVSISFNILINTYHLQLHISYMHSSVFHFVLGFQCCYPGSLQFRSSVDLKANVSWEVA